MINVEPSFVLYALLLDPGCCLRAHIILIELVEPEGKKISRTLSAIASCVSTMRACWCSVAPVQKCCTLRLWEVWLRHRNSPTISPNISQLDLTLPGRHPPPPPTPACPRAPAILPHAPLPQRNGARPLPPGDRRRVAGPMSSPKLDPANARHWTRQDVRCWCEATLATRFPGDCFVSLLTAVETFHLIDGHVLLQLTAAEWREAVPSIGARKALLEGLAELYAAGRRQSGDRLITSPAPSFVKRPSESGPRQPPLLDTLDELRAHSARSGPCWRRCAWARDALQGAGGGSPSPSTSSRAPSLPSRCLPDAKCQLQWNFL